MPRTRRCLDWTASDMPFLVDIVGLVPTRRAALRVSIGLPSLGVCTSADHAGKKIQGVARFHSEEQPSLKLKLEKAADGSQAFVSDGAATTSTACAHFNKIARSI